VPGQRPVVLLVHGITLSSDSFVLYGRDQSLAFILADAGAAVHTVLSTDPGAGVGSKAVTC
jgi:pimeloyl-ACP methyl ester carboxylesterase